MFEAVQTVLQLNEAGTSGRCAAFLLACDIDERAVAVAI